MSPAAGYRYALAAGLAALLLSAAGYRIAGASQAASGTAPRRVVPLAAGEVKTTSGLILSHPRMEESRAADGVPRIEAVRLEVEAAPAGLRRAEIQLTIVTADSAEHTFKSSVDRLAPGADLVATAGLLIPSAAEGAGRIALSVRDGEGRMLFDAQYRFGYPRYETSDTPKRAMCGAPIRDDFDAPRINEALWRIWTTDPDRFVSEQRDGRYWIHVTGAVGYNGLSSLVEMETRDIVAVCRAGVDSTDGALHYGIMHVCGSGRFSPDHWFEIDLRDGEGKKASASVVMVVPTETDDKYRGSYDLPLPAKDGYLLKIVCDGATHECQGFAKVHADWWALGDPFEVPARATHLEIKTNGAEEKGRSSTIWFDDCRVYPRPQTHYVTVMLVRADGQSPGARGDDGRPICFDGENNEIPGCDLTVRLYAADGKTLVSEAHSGPAFGYALLPLSHAPWDTYPVAAVLRVFWKDVQLGPDHVIESRGVEGLYPDDVYTLALE